MILRLPFFMKRGKVSSNNAKSLKIIIHFLQHYFDITAIPVNESKSFFIQGVKSWPISYDAKKTLL